MLNVDEMEAEQSRGIYVDVADIYIHIYTYIYVSPPPPDFLRHSTERVATQPHTTLPARKNK